jgi:hypothetical protein
MTRRLYLACLCSLLLIHGCGFQASPPPRTYPVRGKVVLAGGEPLAGAVVTLHPKDPPGNEALGYVETDGTFKMGTFAKEDGAIPGRYVVTVEPLANRTPGGKAKPNALVARIPRRYWGPETSQLEVEVKAQDNELAPFHLR